MYNVPLSDNFTCERKMYFISSLAHVGHNTSVAMTCCINLFHVNFRYPSERLVWKAAVDVPCNLQPVVEDCTTRCK